MECKDTDKIHLSSAKCGCGLTFLIPLTSHIVAFALSEYFVYVRYVCEFYYSIQSISNNNNKHIFNYCFLIVAFRINGTDNERHTDVNTISEENNVGGGYVIVHSK